TSDNILGGINNEYNGVLIGSSLADEQLFRGKGAGRYPTASAVLSDISALRYGYKYEFKKGATSSEGNSLANSRRRVYLGTDNGLRLDETIFVELHERFINPSRQYIIGVVSLDKLK